MASKRTSNLSFGPTASQKGTSKRTTRISFEPTAALQTSDSPKSIGCCAKDGWDSLFRLNVAAAVLHAIFALATLYVGITGKSPFAIVVTTSLPIVPVPIPAPFNDTTCKGKTYDDVFDWFQCIRENNNYTNYTQDLIKDEGYTDISDSPTSPDSIMPPFKTEFITTDGFQLWTLIFTFSLLTAISHLLIATKFKKAYEYWLKNDRQPLRYFEYSITASIMFVIVLALSRVTDMYLLIANALLMCTVNVFGGILEWVSIDTPLKEDENGKSYPPSPSSIDTPLKEDENGKSYPPSPSCIRAWAWATSAIVFIFQFWQLYNIFDKTVIPYTAENNPSKDLWLQLFGFVNILNAAIATSFTLFPIVNFIQFIYLIDGRKSICFDDKVTQFIAFEAIYIFLSFLAKGFLVVIVLAASVQRK